jgi:pilus assembly protein Flp/PilA
MIKKFKQFLKNEDGATAVEYGLMVALIAGVIIGTVYFLGQETNNKFDAVGKAIDAAPDPTPITQ